MVALILTQQGHCPPGQGLNGLLWQNKGYPQAQAGQCGLCHRGWSPQLQAHGISMPRAEFTGDYHRENLEESWDHSPTCLQSVTFKVGTLKSKTPSYSRG